MAELPSTDIRLKADVAPLFYGGGAGSTNISLTNVCNHANVNKFSHFRSRPIQVSGSLLCQFVSPAPTTNRKLGDFRRYDHAALTPELIYNSTPPNTYAYGPWSSGTVTFTIQCNAYQWNLIEATANSILYWQFDYYLSSTNRASGTSRFRRFTDTTNILIAQTGIPPGHTNSEVGKATYTMTVQDTGFDPSAIVQPDDTVYIDAYIVNNAGTAVARVGTSKPDSYLDISFHEYTTPFIDASGPFVTPAPKVNVGAGDVSFTFVAVKVTNASSGKNGVDFAQTAGSSSYGGAGFYWYIYGLAGSNYYRIGSRTVTAVLRLPGGTLLRSSPGTDTTVLSGALNTAGASSNENDSGTLAAGQTWLYDDEADIVITSVDWTAATVLTPGAGEVYDLGTTAPT